MVFSLYLSHIVFIVLFGGEGGVCFYFYPHFTRGLYHFVFNSIPRDRLRYNHSSIYSEAHELNATLCKNHVAIAANKSTKYCMPLQVKAFLTLLNYMHRNECIAAHSTKILLSVSKMELAKAVILRPSSKTSSSCTSQTWRHFV